MSNEKKLADKVIVVTGSSRGLGKAMALRLAQEGALVVVNYRSQGAEAEATVSAIEAAGGRAFAVQGDLGNVAGIDAFYAALDRELEHRTGSARFDMLVANAGVMLHGTIGETTEAGFDQVFDVNVKGVFFLVQKGLSRMRDNGRIVTLSSGLSRFSYPQYIAYSATKGAIDVFTRVLAATVGERGITVNAVAPGAINTEMNAGWIDTPEGEQMVTSIAALKRVGQPEDIGDILAFLASEDSRWVTGQRIEASGGAHL